MKREEMRFTLKTWSYPNEILTSWDYTIEDWSEVTIICIWDKELDFCVWNNSTLRLLCISLDWGTPKVKISAKGEKTKVKVSVFIIAWDINTKASIFGSAIWENANIKIWALWIATGKWKIFIESWISILKWSKKSLWEVHQELIPLSSESVVSSLPALDIFESDSRWNHSMKIENIDPEKLFYMESRWFDRKQAMLMILESRILNLISDFKDIQPDLEELILNNIKQELNK